MKFKKIQKKPTAKHMNTKELAHSLQKFFNAYHRNMTTITKEVNISNALSKDSKDYGNIGLAERQRLYQLFAAARLYYSPVDGVSELFLISCKDNGTYDEVIKGGW